MRMWKMILMLILGFMFTSCSLLPTASGTEEQGSTLAATDNAVIQETETITPTHPLETNTPELQRLEVEMSDPDQVAYDFVTNLCLATWTNNGQEIECPSRMEDSAYGIVDRLDETFTDHGLLVDVPTILTIPAHGTGYGGIFGKYPPYYVKAGDYFRAVIAYQESDNPHNISHELYFEDSSGKVHLQPHVNLPIDDNMNENSTKGYRVLNYPLDNLKDQWVRFMLAIQNNNGTEYDEPALWINPHIWRDPQVNSSNESAEDNTPGVISGSVDISTAPPYLNDPVLGGSAVVVVFFNQDEGKWWWMHTTGLDQSFQMTVSPGYYQVAAYAQGVGDVAYVTGGYTGKNPSCGEAMKIVDVKPNQHINGIEIADWNWTCGGTASRPLKPDEVPLP